MQEIWVQPLGWEDPLGEGNGNPLQYSCLENPMDRGDWWATVHGVTESQTQLKGFGTHAQGSDQIGKKIQCLGRWREEVLTETE